MKWGWVRLLQQHKFEIASVIVAGAYAAREFFEPIFFGRDEEVAVVAFFDNALRINHLLLIPGCATLVEIPMPSVVASAMDHAGMIIAHNHPSGDPQPSALDIKLTQRLALVAEATGCELLDHLIFGGGKMVSLRQKGLL